MTPSFWVVLAAGLALFLLHYRVGRRYVNEYVAVYQRLPGWSWPIESDKDPTVERWRRRRLAVAIPMLVLFTMFLFEVGRA